MSHTSIKREKLRSDEDLFSDKWFSAACVVTVLVFGGVLAWQKLHPPRGEQIKGTITAYKLLEEPWVEVRARQGLRPRILRPEYKVLIQSDGKTKEVWVPSKSSGMPDEIEKFARSKVGKECEFEWNERWQSVVAGC